MVEKSKDEGSTSRKVVKDLEKKQNEKKAVV